MWHFRLSILSFHFFSYRCSTPAANVPDVGSRVLGGLTSNPKKCAKLGVLLIKNLYLYCPGSDAHVICSLILLCCPWLNSTLIKRIALHDLRLPIHLQPVNHWSPVKNACARCFVPPSLPLLLMELF